MQNIAAAPLEYDRDLSTDVPLKYRMILDRLRPGSRILEVGCHTGYFSEVLAAAGHFVTGVEIDATAASVARARGITVYEKNVAELGEVKEFNWAFDVVLLMDVLEHNSDPLAALQSVKSCIPRGGRIMITAPNIAYWKVRLDLLRGKWAYADGGIMDRTHLRFFPLEGWKKLIADAGLEIHATDIADHMLPVESHLRRLPALGGAVGKLSAACASRWPELFAIGFFFECRTKTITPQG